MRLFARCQSDQFLTRLSRIFLPLLILVAATRLTAQFAPKVVVVATYELGADTGDKPGEFQFWVERAHLTNSLAVPGVDRPLRWRDDGVWGAVSGTTVRAGLQMMALLHDPRFDFRETYWLVNGIAGVDAENASIGSAAWSRWVVDGDIAYELDSREAPADWPYGVVPVGGKKPNEIPRNAEWAPKPLAWKLNPALVNWAYGLTKDLVIPETEAAKAHRARFTATAAGQAPPRVLLGESLGSCRYWHGAVMTKWANDWTRLHTGGEGDFVMTNMEDQGLAAAFERLGKLGKLDFQRVLFLRTGSNYSGPHPGQTSAESMTEEYSGTEPALESAWLAGSRVVNALVAGWDRYQQTPPAP
jgi:purine nucleoside permease